MSENTMLVPQMGINMEQATANCEELAKGVTSSLSALHSN